MVRSEGLHTWEGAAEVEVDSRFIVDVEMSGKLEHIQALKLLLQSNFAVVR